MTVAMIQNTTGKGAETRSIIEGQQHREEKKAMQEV
jgi:hypothetical protein